MFDVIPVPVKDVKEHDELANGETVIDTWQDANGYCLHLEKETSDGSLSYHTVTYPGSAFIRVKKFEEIV